MSHVHPRPINYLGIYFHFSVIRFPRSFVYLPGWVACSPQCLVFPQYLYFPQSFVYFPQFLIYFLRSRTYFLRSRTYFLRSRTYFLRFRTYFLPSSCRPSRRTLSTNANLWRNCACHVSSTSGPSTCLSNGSCVLSAFFLTFFSPSSSLPSGFPSSLPSGFPSFPLLALAFLSYCSQYFAHFCLMDSSPLLIPL